MSYITLQGQSIHSKAYNTISSQTHEDDPQHCDVQTKPEVCNTEQSCNSVSLFSTAVIADHLHTKENHLYTTENHHTESSVSKQYQNCVSPTWALSPVSHSILLCHYHFGNVYTEIPSLYKCRMQPPPVRYIV